MAMTTSPGDANKVQVADEPAHIENAQKPSHVTEIDSFRVVGLGDDDAEFYSNFPDKEKKKIFKKVCTSWMGILQFY